MHNRKKQERPPTDAEVAALKKKSTTYASLVNILFDRRSKHDHSNETLDLIGKMLRNNPDFYTLWNFRREVLFSLHPGLQSAGGASGEKFRDESAAAICEAEMSLSADGIRRNPKSYGAWHHREWIIHRFDVNYSQELELCKEFLRQDQRNFHCWNYRRFVATVAGISPEAELQFSAEKIQENFSNYSAFHHRSIYIKQVSVSSCGMGVGGGINNDTVPAVADRPGSARTRQPLQEIIPGELKIIENAIFTEPDDQSAWWYHQFLMTWIRSEISASVSDAAAAAAAAVVDAASSATITTAPSPSFATANQQQVQQRELVQWFMGVLEQQRELVGSLMEVEDSCRWVLGCMLSMTDTLLWLMGMPGVVSSATTTTTTTTTTSSSNGGGLSVGVEALVAERLLLLDKLLQIDPLHVNRYRYLLQQHQLTSSYY